eukprot:1544087-Pleurochrysis_carterae.AAC.3
MGVGASRRRSLLDDSLLCAKESQRPSLLSNSRLLLVCTNADWMQLCAKDFARRLLLCALYCQVRQVDVLLSVLNLPA